MCRPINFLGGARLIFVVLGFGIACMALLQYYPSVSQAQAGNDKVREIIKYASEGKKVSWPDNALPSAVVEYWQTWASKDARSLFSQEAPFFQEMAHFEKYANYVQLIGAVSGLKKIRLFGLDKVTDHHYILRINVCLEDAEGEEKNMSRKDHWVLVQDTWYHVLKNSMIFSEIR